MRRDETVVGMGTPVVQFLRVAMQAGVGFFVSCGCSGVTRALGENPDKVIGSPSWAWEGRGFLSLWLPVWSDKTFLCESPGGVT